MYIKNIYY